MIQFFIGLKSSLGLFLLVVGSVLGGWSLPDADAAEWQVRVLATDSYAAHMGGDYEIFLEVLDNQGDSIDNLAVENVSLKVNQRPHLLSDFQDASAREQRVILLYAGAPSIEASSLELLKTSFSKVIEQKQDSIDWVLGFKGDEQSPEMYTEKSEVVAQLKAATTTAVENSDSDLDFLLDTAPDFLSLDKRHWVVFVTTTSETKEETDVPEELPAELLELTTNHSVTLLPIVVGKNADKHWTHRFAEETQSQLFQIDSFDTLPSILEQVAQKIGQEYVLSYSYDHSSNDDQQVEISLISPEGTHKVRHTVALTPIWAHHSNFLIAWFLGLLGVTGLILWIKKRQEISIIEDTGFQIMTPGENFKFIELTEESYNLDFLTSIETHGKLRLSANLGKVLLKADQGSYFLEDKNYKNALLINRRRVRRTMLRHGDVLDIGEMTLIFLNRKKPVDEELKVEEQDKKPEVTIHYDRPQGPIRKKIGMLVDESTRQEYYLTKNVTFIGRSKTNNLVLNSPSIALRHAKLIRVGIQYKLQSLSTHDGSFVNRRRIEQRFLRDGDELSFDNCRFRFHIVHTLPSRQERGKGGHHS